MRGEVSISLRVGWWKPGTARRYEYHSKPSVEQRTGNPREEDFQPVILARGAEDSCGSVLQIHLMSKDEVSTGLGGPGLGGCKYMASGGI